MYSHVLVTVSSDLSPLHLAITVSTYFVQSNMNFILLTLLLAVVVDHQRRYFSAGEMTNFLLSTPTCSSDGSDMVWQTPIINIATPNNALAVSDRRCDAGCAGVLLLASFHVDVDVVRCCTTGVTVPFSVPPSPAQTVRSRCSSMACSPL